MKTLGDIAIILIAFFAGFAAISQFKEGEGPLRLDPYITDPSCGPPSDMLVGRFATDSNTDPLFRAGAIPLFSERYRGHGFLVNQNSRLYFVTIEHVADIAEGDCAYYYFPGADFFALARYSRYVFSQNRRSENDELVSFEIKDNLHQRLTGSVQAGQIAPLIVSYNVPQSGSIVAIPNDETGQYTLYTIDQRENGYISLITNGQYGLICGGRSGSPVQLVENGLITNQVIAVISSINKGAMFDAPDGNHCGYVAYAVRF